MKGASPEAPSSGLSVMSPAELSYARRRAEATKSDDDVALPSTLREAVLARVRS